MPDISKINGVAIADISKLSGRTLANGDKVMGITKPTPSETTILSVDFNSVGSVDGSSATLPSGWAKADSGNMTVYGSTTDSDMGGNQDTRGWVIGTGSTTSSGTGPNGGHQDGVDATDGAQNTTTAHRYMYLEASNPAGSASVRKQHLIRTGELDFSSFSTITMTFWFHHYSAFQSTDHSGDFGVTATTDNNDASSGAIGFTSDTAGGATIVYWTADDGSSTASAVRINSSQQTSNAAKWRKATVDLSAMAGESSVYIYFFSATKATTYYWCNDTAIDSIKVVGS